MAFLSGPDSGTLPRVSTAAPEPDRDLPSISVTLAGHSITVPRTEVKYAEATGDYARLVTRTATHLVRIPIAELTARWSDHGFVRVHRRWLVQFAAVTDVRMVEGRMQLQVGQNWLEVSRRRAGEVRALLAQRRRDTLGHPIRPEQGTVP